MLKKSLIFSGVSNLEVRSGVVENTVGMYNDANKKLHSAVFHLSRSQAAIQVHS